MFALLACRSNVIVELFSRGTATAAQGRISLAELSFFATNFIQRELSSTTRYFSQRTDLFTAVFLTLSVCRRLQSAFCHCHLGGLFALLRFRETCTCCMFLFPNPAKRWKVVLMTPLDRQGRPPGVDHHSTSRYKVRNGCKSTWGVPFYAVHSTERVHVRRLSVALYWLDSRNGSVCIR